MSRISSDKEFNGIKLLDGSFQNQTFQIGANEGETINVSIGDIDPTKLGTPTETVTDVYAVHADGYPSPFFFEDLRFKSVDPWTYTYFNSNDSFTIACETGDANVVLSDNDNSARDIAELINNTSELTGVAATAETRVAFIDYRLAIPYKIPQNITFTIKGKDIATITAVINETYDVPNLGKHGVMDHVAEAINQKSDVTGIVAEYDQDKNFLYLINSEGYNIYIRAENTIGGITDGKIMDGYLDVRRLDEDGNIIMGGRQVGWPSGASIYTVEGSVKFSSNSAFSINSGTDQNLFLTSKNYLSFLDTPDITHDTASISEIDISTQHGAQDAISVVDDAIDQIDEERSKLGAAQNRFESVIFNLRNISKNLSIARSRVMDADISAETSSITKQNILQQATQANQQPQMVLSLLENL